MKIPVEKPVHFSSSYSMVALFLSLVFLSRLCFSEVSELNFCFKILLRVFISNCFVINSLCCLKIRNSIVLMLVLRLTWLSAEPTLSSFQWICSLFGHDRSWTSLAQCCLNKKGCFLCGPRCAHDLRSSAAPTGWCPSFLLSSVHDPRGELIASCFQTLTWRGFRRRCGWSTWIPCLTAAVSGSFTVSWSTGSRCCLLPSCDWWILGFWLLRMVRIKPLGSKTFVICSLWSQVGWTNPVSSVVSPASFAAALMMA
jgi:hypothetical protein